MIELTKNTSEEVTSISKELLQLKNLSGDSVFITDPEGKRIELRTTNDGSKIIFTQDEEGRSIGIEERANGTRLYHISSDGAGLPSTHELRLDNTEIVYFYDSSGTLQHFVELKPNGDRISTLISENGSIYSIEQRQVGGIIFHGFYKTETESKEGMAWLHPDGELSTHGDKEIVKQICSKFSKFLDGVESGK